MSTDPFERAVDRDRHRRAEQRRAMVRAGFRYHLVAYLAVQVLLVTTWAVTGGGFPWFVFPLLGWGIGLAVHGLVAYGSTTASKEER
jgi:hypothetical protein